VQAVTHNELHVLQAINRCEGLLLEVLGKLTELEIMNAETQKILADIDTASTAAGVRVQAALDALKAAGNGSLDPKAMAALQAHVAWLTALAANPAAPVPPAPPVVTP
jgi:hypothetical protein